MITPGHRRESSINEPMKQRKNGHTKTVVRKGTYKRPFDLTLLLFAHVLLLPFWLVLWTLIPITIWLVDRGPIFYKQQRAGKNGRVFVVRKFRTMVPDAYLKGPAWTVEGDLRLTKVGKFLRRTAFDELPELWSVLKGDMSFVGPRPLDVTEQHQLEEQIMGFDQRLLVRPGLTGLAQVYEPADHAINKLKYDIEYLGSMSPWLDGKLILRSAINSLGAKWDHRTSKPTAPEDGSSDPAPSQLQNEPASHKEPSYRV